jgi:hypothetical protein
MRLLFTFVYDMLSLLAFHLSYFFLSSFYLTLSLPPPTHNFRYGHRPEAACSEIHKAVSGMSSPWNINVLFFLVYEEKDCQSFSIYETKRHTYVIRGTCHDAIRPTHSTLTTPKAISLTRSIHAMPLWPSKAANYYKGRIAVNIQYFRTLNIGHLDANADAVSLSSVHLIRKINLFSFKTLVHFICSNSGSTKTVRIFIHVQQTESKVKSRHRAVPYH